MAGVSRISRPTRCGSVAVVRNLCVALQAPGKRVRVDAVLPVRPDAGGRGLGGCLVVRTGAGDPVRRRRCRSAGKRLGPAGNRVPGARSTVGRGLEPCQDEADVGGRQSLQREVVLVAQVEFDDGLAVVLHRDSRDRGDDRLRRRDRYGRARAWTGREHRVGRSGGVIGAVVTAAAGQPEGERAQAGKQEPCNRELRNLRFVDIVRLRSTGNRQNARCAGSAHRERC